MRLRAVWAIEVAFTLVSLGSTATVLCWYMLNDSLCREKALIVALTKFHIVNPSTMANIKLPICHCVWYCEEIPSQVRSAVAYRSLPCWGPSNRSPTTCCDLSNPKWIFKRNHRHSKIIYLSLFWQSASSLSVSFEMYLPNTLYHRNGTQSLQQAFRRKYGCLKEWSIENQSRNLLRWHKTGGKYPPLLLKSQRQIWTLFHYFPRARKKVTSS